MNNQEEENPKEIHRTGKKVINITYVVKCGCGSTYEYAYHAIVPEDYHDVEDGDIIDNFDKMVELERVAGEIYAERYEGSVKDHNPDDYYVW